MKKNTLLQKSLTSFFFFFILLISLNSFSKGIDQACLYTINKDKDPINPTLNIIPIIDPCYASYHKSELCSLKINKVYSITFRYNNLNATTYGLRFFVIKQSLITNHNNFYQ